jgi:hypothetical protein
MVDLDWKGSSLTGARTATERNRRRSLTNFFTGEGLPVSIGCRRLKSTAAVRAGQYPNARKANILNAFNRYVFGY